MENDKLNLVGTHKSTVSRQHKSNSLVTILPNNQRSTFQELKRKSETLFTTGSNHKFRRMGPSRPDQTSSCSINHHKRPGTEVNNSQVADAAGIPSGACSVSNFEEDSTNRSNIPLLEISDSLLWAEDLENRIHDYQETQGSGNIPANSPCKKLIETIQTQQLNETSSSQDDFPPFSIRRKLEKSSAAVSSRHSVNPSQSAPISPQTNPERPHQSDPNDPSFHWKAWKLRSMTTEDTIDDQQLTTLKQIRQSKTYRAIYRKRKSAYETFFKNANRAPPNMHG